MADDDIDRGAPAGVRRPGRGKTQGSIGGKGHSCTPDCLRECPEVAAAALDRPINCHWEMSDASPGEKAGMSPRQNDRWAGAAETPADSQAGSKLRRDKPHERRRALAGPARSRGCRGRTRNVVLMHSDRRMIHPRQRLSDCAASKTGRRKSAGEKPQGQKGSAEAGWPKPGMFG